MSTDTTMTTAANATDGNAHTIVLVGHGMVASASSKRSPNAA